MILNAIIEEKRKEIEDLKSRAPQKTLLGKIKGLKAPRKRDAFKRAIEKPRQIHLIAEVKKASPSAGLIRKDFDPLKIALTYEANGAAAISVLTDRKFFQGDLSHLKKISKSVSTPVLRKDFIIDEYQIYESAAAGADACLLIADLISARELKRFMDTGSRLGLDFLVEVHTEEDVEKAVNAECGIIGINNRDLRTFKVDLNTTTRLLKVIPEGKIVVSESGINEKKDISYLSSLGVNAVLIGEAFMRSDDISQKMKELLG